MATTIQIANLWDDLLEPRVTTPQDAYDAALRTALETYDALVTLFPGFPPSSLYGSMVLLSPANVWTGVLLWRTFQSPSLSEAQTSLLDTFIPVLERYLDGLSGSTWVSLYSPNTDSVPSWSSAQSASLSR